MWWNCLAFILATSAVIMTFRGAVAALGWGVIISFVFPCWITHLILGVPLDLRISTSFVLSLLTLFQSARRITWSFNATDWAVLALYGVHVTSDSIQDGFGFSHMVRAFGEWSLPYIAGRLSARNVEDWRWLTWIAVTVAVLLAVWAVTESITRVNIGDSIFGVRPADRTDPMAIRGGFKRAEGPTRHAIWFGMIQVLLLPFTVAAAYRSVRNEGPLWWIVAPICSLCGTCATVSRGPVLAAVAVLYLTALLSFPKLRVYLVVLGIAVCGFGVVMKDTVIRSLEWVEPDQWSVVHENKNTVEFEGETHRLSTLSYRWLEVIAYLPAISEAGFFGFGTERTSTFPVNVPMGPSAEQTVSVFWSIDCEYLLLILRFGWLGLVAFIAIGLFSAFHMQRQALFLHPPDRLFPNAIVATLIATSLALLVEWMPHDYGFVYLWLCGVANGIRLSGSFSEASEMRTIQRESLRASVDRISG